MDLNRKDIISSHNLIFETAPDIWQNGFPVGNGHFGAMVYQPENSIEFAISKLDVWDRRADLPPRVPFSEIKRIIAEEPEKLISVLATESKQKTGQLPGPKPCGKLNISFDKGFIEPTIFDKTQTLNLYEGICQGNYEISTKQMGFTVFVSPYENLLVVKMEDLWTDDKLKFAYTQEITLSREIDLNLGMPAVFYQDGISFIKYKFPDNFEYVIGLLVDGIDTGEIEVYPDAVKIKIMLDYQKKRRYSYCIYLAVATAIDSENPQERVCEILKTSKEEGYRRVEKRHKGWWANFWEKSAVQFDNKFIEALWYFSLYQFASSSRGDIAPGLFGLWNASKNPPWCGDYHGDINMAMTYWPIFSTNHIELGEPFFKTFRKLLPVFKKQTEELYQIDGIKFPIATLDTGVELCGNYYRMMQCTTGFYGLIFWNRYLYTKDKKILEKDVFPVLEEGAKFYLALTEEKDGQVIIGPSWAPEQGPIPAYNVNNDLGLIKALWKAYVKACDILKKKSPYREKVEYYLQNFPDYPQKGGEFLDSLTAGDFIGLSHPGLLAMVVPGNDVDAESPLAPVALNTLHNFLPRRTIRRSFADRISSSCDLTWPWLLAVSVRLRDLKYAEHILMDIAISEFLKPNGMFAFIGGGVFNSREEKRAAYNPEGAPVPYISPSEYIPAGKCVALHALFALACSQRGKEQMMSMLQQPSGFLYAIDEMLLQSYGGCIKIFPAVPRCLGKNCAFDKLLAEGGFEVSSVMENRKTVYVKLKSLCGGLCRLKIYNMKEREIVFKTSRGKVIKPEKLSDGTYQWNTVKGEIYMWKDKQWSFKKSIWKVESPSVKTFIDLCGNTITYGKKGHIFER
ncbi:MAG TPA: glycoside hydrolase N-terminal domain-containing protein [bacterium]|nr:glycoside hydrolase N-terminal domain-containing protein [bacterium]HPP29639.1 glycoside hydrolase N-terminal domain-containing protein [bacterium]